MVTAAPVARPPCKIHPTAVVAEKAQLTGTHLIEIGENSVIQPYARIQADGGPVTIGKYCVVFESVVLSVPERSTGEVILGDYVLVERAAQITSAKVNVHTDIGVACSIEAGAVVGKHCKLAPKQTVRASEELSDFTIVFSDDNRRTDTSSRDNEKYRNARLLLQQKRAEVMHKIIPNAAAKHAGA